MRTFTFADLQDALDASLGAGNAIPLYEHNLDTTYDELGVDSLTLYELVTRIQDNFAVAVTDDQVDQMTTPRRTLDTVNARLADGAETTA
ncbi:act minimal PKS acyl carrier protein [Amycolatopsis cihanbeyliensis]|uniref:Act minimal PKS acyl carrier protein n=1 Tax=Amycolatopsis cihanbeyliensis TaxID=1128664 RepID=A0A542DBS0_AMYCI|nr:act minimal PKS acyl carrier protein [Amycolatopsis cihanbeyliensis]